MYKDFSSGHSDPGSIDFTSLSTTTIQASGTRIDLPADSFVRDAEFSREGHDLILKGPDGEIVIEGYFAAVPTPALSGPNGLVLTPQLVESFTRSPLQYADANGSVASDESPVGAVSEISGEAHVTRLDGTVELVQLGMPIYQGDIVETDTDGAVNIMFIDETSFAVSEDARLSIDEYVFDPATAEGTTNFSVLKGMFVFTSGMIGREDPDDVHIETPQGSIGIRGTIIAGDVTNGEITVVEGAIVLRDFSGNEMTLATQFETAKFDPSGGNIQNMGQMSASDVAGKFAPVSGVSGNLFSSINDTAGENGTSGNEAASEGAGNDGEPAAQNSTNAQDQSGDEGGTAQQDGAQDAGQESGSNSGESSQENSTEQPTEQSADQPANEQTQDTNTQSQNSNAQAGGSGFESGSLDGSAKSAGAAPAQGSGQSAGAQSGAPAPISGSGNSAAPNTGSNAQNPASDPSSSTTNAASEPPPNVLNDGSRPNDNTATAGDTRPDFIWTPAGQIAENAAAGTSVATLGLSAADAGRYGFTITNGDPSGAFTIDTNGNIVLDATGALDYETLTQHDLEITVTENGTNIGTYTAAVNIADINEFAPIFDGGAPTAATIDEDANTGDSITTLLANDGDGSATLSYTIDSGNADGIFSISNTGEITIADTTNLDFETTDSYTLSISVSDGTTSDTHNITISINDIDEMAIAGNGTISGAEDTVYTFTASEFNYTDPEGAALDSIMITTLPSQGTLFYDGDLNGILNAGEIIALNDVITAFDINNGYLKFVGGNDNYGNNYDTFGFAVSTDGTTYSNSANIDIDLSPVNDGPQIVTNTGANVNEGDFVILTTAMLNINDPDDLASDVTYTTTTTNGEIYVNGVIQSTFTHQDLINGQVKYTHDGSETTSATINFNVADGGEDGASGDSTTFNITVAPVDDTPDATSYGGSALEGAITTLSTAMLDASDNDTADANITFDILGVTNGHIAYSGDPGTSITSFTRAELDNGDIVFVHDGSETFNADIDYTVSDGTTTTSIMNLPLSISEVNDTPTFAIPSDLAPQYYVGDTAAQLFEVSPGDISDGENGLQGFKSFTIKATNINDSGYESLTISGQSVLIDGTSTSINIAGNTFNVSMTETSAGTFEIYFTANTPGTDELSASELENALNSMAYHNNAPNGTAGQRTISITEIVDAGGNINGGNDTLTLSGYDATVLVTTIIDLNNLSPGDGFTINDDLALGYGAYFQSGTDIQGDGYDDLLIGRGEDTMFQLMGQQTGYSDFDLASAPADHFAYGNNPLLGYATGSGKISDIGDFNGDGISDYAYTNYTHNSDTGQVNIWLGTHEFGQHDVDGAGNGTIVDTYIMGSNVISILADGQRFISTPLDSNDLTSGTSSLDNTDIPSGNVIHSFYDEGNDYLITLSDNSSYGSLSIYDMDNGGALVNQTTSIAEITGAKGMSIVEVGGTSYAYILSENNEIIRLDDIYGTMSTPNTINLGIIQSALNSIYSGFPAPVQPSENFDSIKSIFSDGTDIYVIAARSSGLSSLVKMNVTSNIDGSAAIDHAADSVNGLETQANMQLQNMQATYMDGNTLYAIYRDNNGTSSLFKTTLPLADPSEPLSHTVNGGEESLISSDLFPSIVDPIDMVINAAGDKIAILNKYGTVTEFDVSGGLSNPNVLSIASSDDYIDGQLNYGPNGNILLSAGDEIITINSGGASVNADPAAAGDDMSGRDMVALGDINNDGLQDFIYSSPTNGSTGRATVVLGDTSGSATSRIDIVGINTNGEGRIPLLNFGDLNGDGHTDYGIGEGGANRLHIFLGNSIVAGANFDINDNAFKNGTNGEGYTLDFQSDSKMILSAGDAGDFDGDGINDLVIALKGNSSSDYDVELFVLYGGQFNAGDVINYNDLGNSIHAFKMNYTIENTGDANDFHMVLSNAGDINGDGYDDLAIGTPGVDNAPAADSDGNSNLTDDQDGSVHVVYGRDARDSIDIEGTTSDDILNSSDTDQIINGGAGDDILIQDNTAHTNLTMHGGGGDDRFTFISNDMDSMHLNGGAGFDTVAFNNTDLDFRNVSDLQAQRIEALEFNSGSDSTLTLSLQNLINLMNSSDTNELTIKTDNQGTDTLIIDHDGAGVDGGGSVGSIEAALESIFGADSVSHESDGTMEHFTIGSMDLNIDSNLITNTQVIDAA